MIEPVYLERLRQVVPFLQEADTEIIEAIRRSAFFARLPAGQDILREGDEVSAIPLLIAGVVRVYKISHTGREITLYRFGEGGSCILSANAILGWQTFSANATVEEDAEAIMIPADAFGNWVGRYPVWSQFVFDMLTRRMVTLVGILEEISFNRMDVRVASLLVARGAQQARIVMTHQEIAAELGSSREVISRILENLASQGLIRLNRGTIDILDLIQLTRLANG